MMAKEFESHKHIYICIYKTSKTITAPHELLPHLKSMVQRDNKNALNRLYASGNRQKIEGRKRDIQKEEKQCFYLVPFKR